MKIFYVNPWHRPFDSSYGPVMYETNSVPVKHAGYWIYQRVSGAIWDVVRDGRCITQRAGIRGAKEAAQLMEFFQQ